MKFDLEKIEKIRRNKRVRQVLAHQDPLWFALLYLTHHFNTPFAPFHMEMFEILKNPQYKIVTMMAFRESGKSTIMNMVNTLWSVLGKLEKKFVIIASKTQEQAKNHFSNIKAELQNNSLLIEDFGPFMENKSDWNNKLSLEIEYHGSKILSVTADQSVRGLKYGQFRPELIVCDDLEDISTTRKESDDLMARFESEILPLGNIQTRIIVLGNLISEKSLLMKLKDRTDNSNGIFRAYPLLDDNGKCLWSKRFPNAESVMKTQEKLSRDTWTREYLLSLEDYLEDAPEEGKKNERIITARARKKWATNQRRYMTETYGIKTQSALIPSMEEFQISAPVTGQIIISEPNDPQYSRYQQYLSEEKKITEEFHNELKQALWYRDENARNRERVEIDLPPIYEYIEDKIDPDEIDWGKEDLERNSPDTFEQETELSEVERKKREKMEKIGYWDPDFE